MDMIDYMPKIIGFSPILDEIECIEGWFKNISSFCHEVWAIYDPRSKDGTTEWLKKKAEETKNAKVPLKLFEQDITQGDSTRYERGKRDEIIYLWEVNRFLHEKVPEGTWCVWLAADERIDVKLRDQVFSALNQAEVGQFDCLVFDLYDLYPDDQHRVGYEHVPGLILTHKKFFKRGPNIHFGTRAHDGETGMYRPLRTRIPFYHFGYVKETKQECWWRNWDGLHLVEKLPKEKAFINFKNPIKDWRHEA